MRSQDDRSPLAALRVTAARVVAFGGGRVTEERREGQPLRREAAATACFSSSGERSCTRWAIAHWKPNGSTTCPYRSPQNVSSTGLRTVAPASTAFLNAAFASSTY